MHKTASNFVRRPLWRAFRDSPVVRNRDANPPGKQPSPLLIRHSTPTQHNKTSLVECRDAAATLVASAVIETK
jgi:hypothetical protein